MPSINISATADSYEKLEKIIRHISESAILRATNSASDQELSVIRDEVNLDRSNKYWYVLEK